MIAALSLLLSLVLHADDRPWGVAGDVSGATEASLLPCANFLRGHDTSNQAKLALAKRRAVAKLTAISRAAAEVEKPMRSQMADVARAAEAAVTKHHHEYEEAKDLRKLDYQRHLAILEIIAKYDEKRPLWSLYQIERVLKTRHSVAEYADCVDDDDADPAAH